MPDIARYRPEDRPAIEALYHLVFGDDATRSFRGRWEWLYARNPKLPDGAPLIWVVRDEGKVVGQFATVPVRLSIHGEEIDGSWGADVVVHPDEQGKGLGEALYREWDRFTGASLGISMTDASIGLARKLGWPHIGQIPRMAKPISEAAHAQWKRALPSRRARVADRVRHLAGALRPGVDTLRPVTAYDARFTRLWERIAPKFGLAVRRDADYLAWRYLRAPHLAYSTLALTRRGELAGWAVFRHAQDGPWRVTMLVDFLADPDDASALGTLLDGVERAARVARTDFARTYVSHAGFQARFREAGWVAGTAMHRCIAKVNGVPVPPEFYAAADTWHITRGDADADR